jgi:hypothetical protein
MGMLGLAMRSIGDEWAHGRLQVFEEHRASCIVSAMLGRIQGLSQRRGGKRGSVLIAAPERNSWTASELWASSDGRLKVCSANLRHYEHAL